MYADLLCPIRARVSQAAGSGIFLRKHLNMFVEAHDLTSSPEEDVALVVSGDRR